MNLKKTALLAALAFLLMTPLTYADLFMDNAVNAVNMFNSMNKKQGYLFTHKATGQGGNSNLNYYGVMTTKTDKDLVDLGAYTAPYASGTNDNGNQIFRTFCVEPGVITSGMVRGKLNYNNGVSTTATVKDNLSL